MRTEKQTDMVALCGEILLAKAPYRRKAMKEEI
jgi:hypothetical protein